MAVMSAVRGVCPNTASTRSGRSLDCSCEISYTSGFEGPSKRDVNRCVSARVLSVR